MRNTLSSNSFPVHQVLVLGSPVHALSVPVRVQMVSVSEAVVVLFRSSDFVKVSGSSRRRGSCTGMDGSCFPEGQGLGNKRSERGMGGRDPEETVGGGGGRAVAGCVSRGGGGQRCRETVWRAEGGREGGREEESCWREKTAWGPWAGRALAGLQSGGLRGPWTGGDLDEGMGIRCAGYLLDSVRSTVLGTLVGMDVDGERVKPLVMVMTNCTEWRVGVKKGDEKDCKG